MIKGWDEGVAQLSKGERAKLTISPDYGYGARGAAGVSALTLTGIMQCAVSAHSEHYKCIWLLYLRHAFPLCLSCTDLQVIPPNATLIFDVELLSFQ